MRIELKEMHPDNPGLADIQYYNFLKHNKWGAFDPKKEEKRNPWVKEWREFFSEAIERDLDRKPYTWECSIRPWVEFEWDISAPK